MTDHSSIGKLYRPWKLNHRDPLGIEIGLSVETSQAPDLLRAWLLILCKAQGQLALMGYWMSYPLRTSFRRNVIEQSAHVQRVEGAEVDNDS